MRMTSPWVTFLLVLLLLQDPLAMAAAGSATVTPLAATASFRKQNSQQRTLHALNRLTFGPRPGDIERVEAMGVDRWIEQQLHPEGIDDSALNARLAKFPAMRLSVRDLALRFPSPATIRAAAEGRASIPGDPAASAIYQTHLLAYEQKRKVALEETSGATTAVLKAPPNSSGTEDNTTPSMEAQEDRLYSDLAVTAMVALPPDQRMKKLVSMRPGELLRLNKKLTPEERLAIFNGLTPEQKEEVAALENPQRMVGGELLATRLLTDIYSERQLQAVMTDFWLNHFNVFLRKGQNAPWYLVEYQRDIIAPRAMGKFEDLLVATAKSPAMLFYLDNVTSVGPHSPAVMMAAMRAQRFGGSMAEKAKDRGLNENYAREVMELHTLGVDGGYSQRDVTELAKVLTGWTIEQPWKGGGFHFDERRHEPGTKTVLGAEIKEDGEKEGLQVLHILASSPATAHFLSRKLAIRFVSDNPPAALVDRMAKSYLRSGGDIREVLRTMFHSPDFWTQDAYRAKVKTPQEFVLSAVRATGGEVEHVAPLVLALNNLGMPLYGCQTPNGYSWSAEAWVNSADLVNRMNFAIALAGNRMGAVTDFHDPMNADAADPAAKEARLERWLLGGEASMQTRLAVLRQLTGNSDNQVPGATAEKVSFGPPKGTGKEMGAGQPLEPESPLPPPPDKQAAIIVGLLLGSPDFQRR